jgi:hypothetical protein
MPNQEEVSRVENGAGKVNQKKLLASYRTEKVNVIRAISADYSLSDTLEHSSVSDLVKLPDGRWIQAHAAGADIVHPNICSLLDALWQREKKDESDSSTKPQNKAIIAASDHVKHVFSFDASENRFFYSCTACGSQKVVYKDSYCHRCGVPLEFNFTLEGFDD